MTTLTALTAANARRWAVARLVSVRAAAFRATARRLVAAKQTYQAVAAKTDVPWHVIAVIHEREASQRWDASLAQGDPWDRVSVHVPNGRGPFASWQAAAIDALMECPPHAARWKDWSVGGTLSLLEQYNGLGYANMELPSPYIWAGTDQYRCGKYVADGRFDPHAVDTQLGCAGMLLAMAEIDAGVATALARPMPSVPIVPPSSTPARPTAPPPPKPAPYPPAWVALLLSTLAKLFGR
jgi:lysozyme family protein